MEFTRKALEKLTPKAKRYNILDPETRGLGLVVHPSGEKTFFHQIKVLGYPRWTTIGAFGSLSIEQARGAAAKLNGAIAQWKLAGMQGPAPFEKKQGGDLTFDRLLTAYVDKHLKGQAKDPQRAEREIRYAIDTHLASWKQRKISTIRRADLAKIHQELGRDRKYAADRLRDIVRAVFNFAIEESLFSGDNPGEIKSFHHESRSRFLQPEEIARLFQALRKAPADLRDFVNLSLWTGARKSNVLGMRWEHVHLTDNRWEIPNPKSRNPYIVALTPEAVDILKARRQKNGESPWVFPATRGKSGHVVNLKKPWQALLAKAKITDLRIHDLRRTLGSWQAASGSSSLIIGKSLGHSDGSQATAVYARLHLDPVRESVMQATRAMITASKNKNLLKAASRG